MEDDSDPYYYQTEYNNTYHYDEGNSTNISSAATNTTQYEYDYYYDYNYYGGVYDDFYHQIFDYEIPLNGYIWPCLVLITTIANILVIWFFLLRQNRTKATSVLFISLAISDSMTGLVTLPGFIHLYALVNDFVSETWCNILMISRLYVSRVFHTVSVWQTVCLGIQRYICVCHPFASKTWCTVKKTVFSIAVMYGLATILHSYHAVDVKTHDGRCTWTINKPCNETCVYLWFVVFTVHLLPCSVLIAVTARTVWALRQSRLRLKALGTLRKGLRSARDRRVTLTVVMVVTVFLIPEVPNGLYFLSVVIREHVYHERVSDYLMGHIIHSVYEVLLVLTFHCNFWIYCTMMHEFRKALRHIFTFPRRRFSQLHRTFSRTISTSDRSPQTTMNDVSSRHPTTNAHSASIEPDQNASIEMCEVSLFKGETHGEDNDNVFC